MPGSSADQPIFETVRPRDVYRLLEIVHTATVRDASFVESRFSETAAHFEETLGFLRELGWVRSVDGRIVPSDDIVSRIVSAAGPDRSLILVSALFEALGSRARPFARYLARFERRGGALIHRPSAAERLEESGPRNFLMDLGIVTHQIQGDFYLLNEPFAEWALWGRNVVSPTANQLRMHSRKNDEIGRGAELVVLDWEKQRVGEQFQALVQHVSDENPTACFDIQSVTALDHQLEARFIEVKAVSPSCLEFHWSGAEIEAAEILRERYFLYLVPVPGSGVFDLDHMEIVQNPYSTVYENPLKWKTSVTDIVCRRIENLDS